MSSVEWFLTLAVIAGTVWYIIAMVNQLAAEKAVEMRGDYQLDFAFYPQDDGEKTSVCITIWYLGNYIKYIDDVTTDTKDEMVKVALAHMCETFKNVRITRSDEE